mmetsp:Transcript_53466/g.95100  ORF Transcript_53466/g.95100 Transcript_53466/m.95100 type:complete len:326 (+) Transcript_53466:52-1029(+)
MALESPSKLGSSLLGRRKLFCNSGLAIACKAEPAVDIAISPLQRGFCQRAKEAGRPDEKYEVFETLGKGTVGNVYRACRRFDGFQVAMKATRTDDQELIAITEAEFKILKEIRHPNIIQVFDFFVTDVGAVLVLEYFNGQTLEKKVHEGGCFNEGDSRQLSIWLLEAVNCLHNLSIMHRDIQAQNVLVRGDGTDLKLCDFNTARRVEEDGSLTITGAIQYRAPEVFLGSSPSFSSDVWALGLCIYLMLSGRLPELVHRFLGSRRVLETAQEQSVSLSGNPWQHVSQSCKDLLSRILTTDQRLRPRAHELFKSDWIRMQVNACDDF